MQSNQKTHTKKTSKKRFNVLSPWSKTGPVIYFPFIRFVKLANKPLEPTFAIFCKRPFCFCKLPEQKLAADFEAIHFRPDQRQPELLTFFWYGKMFRSLWLVANLLITKHRGFLWGTTVTTVILDHHITPPFAAQALAQHGFATLRER